MSNNELHVLIDEAVAGTLRRTPRGQTFTYAPDYMANPAATPLSVSMPIQVQEHSGPRLTAWLWGLLPDDEQVRHRWGRQFHVSTANPFALLSTPLGEDCPGAVRFVRTERLDAILDADAAYRSKGGSPATSLDDPDLRWLTDDDIADLLRDLLRDHTAWLGRDFTGRFSLAGAQAKTALLFHDGRWAQPTGRYATSHILKPAISGLDEHDLNEHLCLSAMRLAGLPTVRTKLTRFADVSAIVVTRYDRFGDQLRRRRVHQEDACQALGVGPEMKYQSDGGPGPEDVAKLIARTHSPVAAAPVVRTFLDALLWNWVIAGTDAHAKNYSLLLSGNQVRLAPLYDVASALPYPMAEQKLRLAMKFGSGYRLNPGGSPWKYLARSTRVSEDEVRSRAAHVIETAPDAMSRAATAPDVRELNSTLPQRLADLVADRAKRCVAVLDRS